MPSAEQLDGLRARFAELVTRVTGKFGTEGIATSEFRDNFRLHVDPSRIYAVLEFLKTEGGFDLLSELGGADYLQYPGAKDRYGVWYVLVNTATGQRVIVKTVANDPDPKLPSVWPLWKGSDWMEREVYDMYGVIFDGHPDLRRILMPDPFTAFPLRKDYPLRGRGERHNFQPITRAES
ncbi:MAG: NADH-quinone oxidoreductase subunit C [Gemmataceae bacterium]